ALRFLARRGDERLDTFDELLHTLKNQRGIEIGALERLRRSLEDARERVLPPILERAHFRRWNRHASVPGRAQLLDFLDDACLKIAGIAVGQTFELDDQRFALAQLRHQRELMPVVVPLE